MRRPIKVYKSVSNKLYMFNKAGKKIYIKTTLSPKLVQKAFIKDYKLNKTKVIKKKTNKIIYRNRPVLAREISNAVVKILKEINKSNVDKDQPKTLLNYESKNAESKNPSEKGKDLLYMSTDERDNLLLKNLEKRRLDNLLTSGIDIRPLVQAINQSEAKNTRLQNLEDLAIKYIKPTVNKTFDISAKSGKKGRPLGSKNKKKAESKTLGTAESKTKGVVAEAIPYVVQDDDEGDEFMPPIAGKGHILATLLTSKLYPDQSLYESEIQTIMMNKNAIYCPVIAKDEIDDIIAGGIKPTFFIMNLSNRNEEGTHWVAVYIDKYDINYFDSFGKPPDKDVKKKLLEISNVSNIKNLKKFKYNKREIQDPMSSDCGYMSIEFLENMIKGETFSKATNFDEKEVRREIDNYEEEFV